MRKDAKSTCGAGIYFTDPRYPGGEPLLAANLWMPNGIAIAPDQRTMYVIAVGDYNTDVTASVPLGGGPPSAIHAYDLAEDRIRAWS